MSAAGRLFAVLALGWVCSPALAGESHLMRYADIHDDTIVFTYEDDLWLVPAEGGDARRITRDPGAEWLAQFSPDGKHIAFTAQYDGGTDVYVMEATGGVPKRLTYHPSPDRVLGWFPDGKHVLFRSRRAWPDRGEEIYRVSIDGGMPERLPVDRAGLTALSPDGTRIAYNRISREDRTWKRHQGGTAQDIWMGSLEKKDYRKITDWVGTDNYPMWLGDAIYFTSDREDGTLNIYRYEMLSGRVTRMTNYRDYDVKYPSSGPGTIVYQQAESLHVLDTKTGKSRQVAVRVPSDRVPLRSEYVEVEPTSGSFRLSPNGKRLVLEARGEILNVPVEEGSYRNLTETPGSREKSCVWSPDGKWIAFYSDRTGEEELYLAKPTGGEWKQLTTGGKGFRRQPEWSPDGKWLVFSDKYLRLNLVDAESGEIKVVDQGEYDDGWYRWGIQDYAWSPDSRWVAYSKLEQSLYESIFLYSVENGTNHRVTSEFTSDWSPTWDPNGKYLYFLSMRNFEPVMGFVDQNHVFLDMTTPFMVLLDKDASSPFAPEEVDEPIADDKEDADEDEDEDEKKSGMEKSAVAEKDGDDADKDSGKREGQKSDGDHVRIDLEGIGRRIIPVRGIEPGNYFRLEATDKRLLYLAKDEHEFLKYQQVNDDTRDRLDLYHYSLEDEEAEEVLSGINNYHLSPNGKKLVYRSGRTYGVVDAGKKAKSGDGKVDLSDVHILVDRAQEFLQIFDEAWRVQRDFFYDPNMHGVDWEATRQQYRRFVPHCGDRSDLNYLIGEMIGELNIGHTYVSGGDIEDGARRVPTGLLGAEFESVKGADFYRISHIYPGTPWDDSERSPLMEPGCGVDEGDYLISIDGKEIRSGDNIYRHLQNARNRVVTVGYNDEPRAEGAKSCRVKTVGSERSLRYREWVDSNRAKVDAATGGKVGYVHIPNMMDPGLIEFAKAFYPQYYKNGMIIDVRYNGGGFTSRMIIDRLEREIAAMTKPREGKPHPDPERCFHGHLVVLINEDTGSDGELFSQAVKTKQLAPLIGMRTWGGAVGIELHQPLVDDGGTTPPQFGPYSLAREWIIEGRGVEPDIEVQNMPADVLAGRDTQLERAVQEVLQRIEEDPRELPSPPAYPVKSKPRGSWK